MANLKGGSFERQIKDAGIRMNRLGERKTADTCNAHSLRTVENRGAMLKDFAQYATSEGMSGKLNDHMTTENINQFLNSRLDGLKTTTQENYIRTFGAMVESLKDNNISIQAHKDDFNSRVHELKETSPQPLVTGRAIDNPRELISNLSFNHSVVAEVQLNLGLRVSEAVEVVNNLDSYLNAQNGTLEGVIGKGGREYQPKEISGEIIALIRESEQVDKRAYQAELQANGEMSHNFRFTYAKEKNEEGLTKAEISQELNHNREEITNYYLNRI